MIRVYLLKVPAISLQVSNFTKNEFLHTYFLRILARFKGYLRYKMKTSQNVPSEAQIKNFLFHRKIMSCSQDIQVFVFLTIP